MMKGRPGLIPSILAAAALVVASISLVNTQGIHPADASSAQKPLPSTTVASAVPAAASDAIAISHNPTDIPAPLSHSTAQKVVLNVETVEVNGKLADGSTYSYWTFGKTVPGPMLRVRQGDTVELHIKNNASSKNVHSIDLHAVAGPGGGAVGTQVKPGEEKSITFKALNPGVYVYHCASPHIPTHIAQGMYGMIVVEPTEGLPKVDREFYVMQGEVYAGGTHNDKGHLPFDSKLLSHESPNFVVFNGAFQALTGDNAMKAKVGETIRLLVGNAGPNLTSSFHIIGTIFDTVHEQGSSDALHNIQTTTIPAGGAAWVEFKVMEPGNYTLVDHAISRAIDKGALATIHVDGDPNPDVFQANNGMDMTGH